MSPSFLQEAKETLSSNHPQKPFKPPRKWVKEQKELFEPLGLKLTKEGRVATIVLAGGQGSRLGMKGPKGLAPVSPVLKRSLFELIALKTRAASTRTQRNLPLAIMTSSGLNQETVNFFTTHDFFGLDPKRVSFFPQSNFPFLDETYNPIKNSSGTFWEGPSGNGDLPAALSRSGLLEAWENEGITTIQVMLVDNPLIHPFDFSFLGFHEDAQAEFSLRVIQREDPLEALGVIVERDNRPNVVEYSEISPEDRSSRKTDGTLEYPLANISSFVISLEFLKAHATTKLPLHAQKKAIFPGGPAAWKFETYLFDLLPHSKNSPLFLSPRSEVFSPLKQAEGKDSFETVRQDLLNYDRQVLSGMIGKPCDQIQFELDPAFYYPSDELRQKWSKKEPPKGGYIEP